MVAKFSAWMKGSFMESEKKNCLAQHSEGTFLAIDSKQPLHFILVENVSLRRCNVLSWWRLASHMLMAGKKRFSTMIRGYHLHFGSVKIYKPFIDPVNELIEGKFREQLSVLFCRDCRT